MLVRSNRFYRMLWVLGFLVLSGGVIGVQLWRQRSEASALSQATIVPRSIPFLEGASLVQGAFDETRIPSVVTWSTTESPEVVVRRYQAQWQQAGWAVGDITSTDASAGFEATQGQGRVQVLAYTTNGQTLVTVTMFHSL